MRSFFLKSMLSALCVIGFSISGTALAGWQENGGQEQAEQEPDQPDSSFHEEQLSLALDEAAPDNRAVRNRRDRQPRPKVTVRNGVTTVSGSERNRKFEITEDPKHGIVVELIRNYGPDDLERLKQNHPELTDYVDLFPKQSGSHQIELNLSIKSIYKARTAEQLKAKSKEAFEVYRQQIKKVGNRR